MIEAIFYVLLGLGFLVLGGEFLVRSASNIALALGVSPLVIGLTVVAYGTSAPELGVSLFASLQGNPEIALSNVIGSNIFNIGFILGLCAMVAPLTVNMQLLKLDVPILVLITGLVYLFALDGQLSPIEGVALFAGAVIYTTWLVWASKKESKSVNEEFSDGLPSKPRPKILKDIFLALGALAVLVGGSRFLVSGATDLAKLLGVSDALIGLTIVAAGTSMPEVATSVMATVRGQKDIAIGNIIGSNIFNILLILGLSSGITSGLNVSQNILDFDMICMLALTALCYPLLVTAKKLVRWEGAVLFSAYIAYTVYLIYRG